MSDTSELVEIIQDLHRRLDVWYQRAYEAEEMLTVATDVAVQRGKRLDAIRNWRDATLRGGMVETTRKLDGILDGADRATLELDNRTGRERS